MEQRRQSPPRPPSFGAIARLEAGIREDISRYWKIVQKYRSNEDATSEEWLAIVLLADQVVGKIEQLRFVSERYIEEHPDDRQFLRFYSHVILFYTANARKADSVFTLANTQDDGLPCSESEASGFWNQRATTKEVIPLVDHPTGNNIAATTHRWMLRNGVLALLPAVTFAIITTIVFLFLTSIDDVYEEMAVLSPRYSSELIRITSATRSAQLASDGIWDITTHESGVTSLWFSQYVQELSVIEAEAETLGSNINNTAPFQSAVIAAQASVSAVATHYGTRGGQAVCPLYSSREDPIELYEGQLSDASALSRTGAADFTCLDSSTCSVDLVSLLANAGLSTWGADDGSLSVDIPCLAGNVTAAAVAGGDELMQGVRDHHKTLGVAGAVVLSVYVVLLLVPLIPLLVHTRQKVQTYRTLVARTMAEMDSLLIYAGVVASCRALRYGVAHVSDESESVQVLDRERLTKELHRLGLDTSSVGAPLPPAAPKPPVSPDKPVDSSSSGSSGERARLLGPQTHIREVGTTQPFIHQTRLGPMARVAYEADVQRAHRYHIASIAALAAAAVAGFAGLLVSLMGTISAGELLADAHDAASLSGLVVEINSLVREMALGLRLYPPRAPFPESCAWGADNVGPEAFTYTCADTRGQLAALCVQLGNELELLDSTFARLRTATQGSSELSSLYETATCFRTGMDLNTPADECHGSGSYPEHSALYPQPIWPNEGGIPVAGLGNVLSYYIGAATLLAQCSGHGLAKMDHLTGYTEMVAHAFEVEGEDICELLVNDFAHTCNRDSSVTHGSFHFTGVCNPLFALVWDIGGTDITQGLDRAAMVRAGWKGSGSTLADTQRSTTTAICAALAVIQAAACVVFVVCIEKEATATSMLVLCESSVVMLIPSAYAAELASSPTPPLSATKAARPAFEQLLAEGRALGLTWKPYSAPPGYPCNPTHPDKPGPDTRDRDTPASVGALCDIIRRANEAATASGDVAAAMHALSALAAAPNTGINLSTLAAVSNAFSETPIPGMHLHDVAAENTASGSPCIRSMRRSLLPGTTSALATEHRPTSAQGFPPSFSEL